ncbi:MAG: inositol-3-phosphate synthase [Acidimicrobiales bacterium]
MTKNASVSTPTPATGRLGVLLPGLGAVSSTLIAGVMAARKGGASPIGSISQLDFLPNPANPDEAGPAIRDALSLASLDDLVFGGWDPISANALEAAETAGVLESRDIAPISGELEGIVTMPAVFDQDWVRNIDPIRVKELTSKWDAALALIDDIERFREEQDCDRLVMVWCGSTEVYRPASEVHESIESFERGLKDNDPNIAPSQIYAYAAMITETPYANGSPNVTCETGYMEQLAEERQVPLSGKDFKTGQTLIKTIIAPALRARMLGLRGWFSTNILGNRDGLVLDDPDSFKAKEVSKLGVLDNILQPERHPELYGEIDHEVRINYYPPRGDQKEGWDSIDIFGWMGYPMQIKVNFLCRDSILAAPIVLDLVLFMDLAARAGESGAQEWLSFYFKAPQTLPGAPDSTIEHDLFLQRDNLLTQLVNWSK